MPVRVSLRRAYALTCYEITWKATIWHTGMKYIVIPIKRVHIVHKTSK